MGAIFTDILGRKVKFNPQDSKHRARVEEDLRQFREARDELLGLDKTLLNTSCLNAGLWLFGYSGLSILILLGQISVFKGYWVPSDGFDRVKLEKKYYEKLDKIMDTYQEMLDYHSVALTKEDIFMEVMEAIAPFVKLDELARWDFDESNPNDIAPRYLKLLSQPPHNRDVVITKEKSIYPGLFWQSSLAHKVAVSNNPSNTDNSIQGKALATYGLFTDRSSLAIAELRRYMYGYERKPEQSPVTGRIAMIW